jgi:imidazolonepropionase-like amidohydrolase
MTGAWRSLHELGAKVVVGSDAGIAPHKPHNVLPHGVAEMVAMGITPCEALTSVTKLAAEACGLGGRKGQIQVGSDADLLVVNGDPTRDAAALLDVAGVFRSGMRVR